jgi:outer membrane protein assembly factor BamB
MVCLAAAAFTGLVPALASPAPARAAAASAAVNWPGFHDNAAHTGYNPQETIIGPGNAASLHQRWLASTDGSDGRDAPTIAGGRVFTNSGELQAWNASTGTLEWSASPQFLSRAAYGDGKVFTDSPTTLYAYDAATGTLDWSVPFNGAGNEPVYAGGLVYVAGNTSVGAYSPTTGANVWSVGVSPNKLLRSVPAVSGGRLFLAAECCRLIALNASTGATIWDTAVGSHDGIVAASPVVSGATVYQCSGLTLFALRVSNGARRWQEPGLCTIDSTPAVANGVLYAANFDAGQFDAVSAATGAIEWSAPGKSSASAIPAVANGVVYFPTFGGTIAAYNAATGARLWTSPHLGFFAGTGASAAPALVNGLLYMGGTAGLYAFGP